MTVSKNFENPIYGITKDLGCVECRTWAGVSREVEKYD
jgi:hypothetical protein